MSAQLIDGTALSQKIRAEVGVRAAALTARGVKPGLAVILVGGPGLGGVCAQQRSRPATSMAMRSVFEKYEASLSEADLLARIRALNADPSHPRHPGADALPKHRSAQGDRDHLHRGDVDGYSVRSAGDLMAGLPGFRPCTPMAA